MASILKLLRVRFVEPSAGRPAKPTGEHVRLTNPWHAVSVVPGTNCCTNVRQYSGRRFLSSQAPPALPLKNCPQIACTCRYRHHDDRRDGKQEAARKADAPAPSRRADDSPAH